MACYTTREYAEEYCRGKVTIQTVHNWIKKWVGSGEFPPGHSLEELPSGKKIIVVEKKQTISKVDKLVMMLEQGAKA